jgi:hypothetical protein
LSIFISYARRDEEQVTELHDKLVHVGHEVWFDRDLRGGQAWWDVILGAIRTSDLVIAVLSPDSVRSRACRREIHYAASMGKTIIPIMVRDVEPLQAPDPIPSIDIEMLLRADEDEWMAVSTAVAQAEPSPPVPEPLPEPPPAPIADLAHAREMVDQPNLTEIEQRQLLDELSERVQDPDERQAVVVVLEQLRGHTDVEAGVADEVDDLLLRYRRDKIDERERALLESLVDDLENQQCTPILGGGVNDWLLGPRRFLAQEWAKGYRFPMAPHRRDDLPGVAQFVAVTHTVRKMRNDLAKFYHDQIVERFPEIVGEGDQPLDEMARAVWKAKAPSQPAEPHAVLARFPCPIYVTTESTTLLAEALREAGKDPVIDFCRWNPDVRRWPESPLEADPDYEPDEHRPLVFHVFGVLEAPDSIVITEDEYFDFLAAVAENNSLIPDAVQEALANSSLLFLGFGLQDWDVRILLRGLISREVAQRLGRNFKHVAAEIDVEEDVVSPDAAREYVTSYFGRFREPPIDIFWSRLEEFTAALADTWERTE